jgi:hypothetical protein
MPSEEGIFMCIICQGFALKPIKGTFLKKSTFKIPKKLYSITVWGLYQQSEKKPLGAFSFSLPQRGRLCGSPFGRAPAKQVRGHLLSISPLICGKLFDII